jgi:hypothetical protein
MNSGNCERLSAMAQLPSRSAPPAISAARTIIGPLGPLYPGMDKIACDRVKSGAVADQQLLKRASNAHFAMIWDQSSLGRNGSGDLR